MTTTPEQAQRALECSREAKLYGVKWGVITGTAALISHFILDNTWSWYKHTIRYQGKIAIPIVAATGGFWVASERKVLECARNDQAQLGQQIRERRMKEREAKNHSS